MFDGNYWTWISGTKEVNHLGVYGEKGVPNVNNLSPAKNRATAVINSNNIVYIFGGISWENNSNHYLMK